MIVLWLLVTIMATWRLTSLIARERGPFAIGSRARSIFGVHHTPDGRPAHDLDGELLLNPVTASARVDAVLHEIALGMTCLWCCGVWVSLGMTLLLSFLAPELVFDGRSYFVVTLAVSAGVIAFDHLV